MKVQDFAQLVSLGQLASLDLDASTAHLGFTFQESSQRTLFYYQGIFVGAITASDKGFKIPGLDGRNPAVSASNIMSLLSVLDEEDDLQVSFNKNDLVLKVGDTKDKLNHARLTLRLIPEAVLPEILKGGTGPAAVCEDYSLLKRALEFLDVITGKAVDKMYLAGIRTRVKNNTMLLEATDGLKGARLRIPVKDIGGTHDYGVIPSADWLAALRSFPPDKHVGIRSATGNKIDIVSGRHRVRLSLFDSKTFPDLRKLPQKYAHSVTLSSKAVVTTIKAAAVLDASRVVTLTTRQGQVILKTEGQEVGTFQAVGGEGLLDFAVMFDGDYFMPIASLGTHVKLYMKDGHSPVMMEGERGEDWRYWVNPLTRKHD